MQNGAQLEPVKNLFWRRLSLALLLLLALLATAYSLAGFFLLPGLAEEKLERYVQQSLGRELRLRDVRFNPFTFTASLNGAELRETDGTLLLSFQSLSADLRIRDLIDGKVIFDEISWQAPWVHLRIDGNGNLNLARLVEDAGAGKQEEVRAADVDSALRFMIKRLQIRNGIIKLTDASGTTPAVAYLVPLNLELNDFGNQPGVKAPINLTAITSGGGSLQWNGDLSLQPLASHGAIHLNGVRALTLWEFLQERLNIDPPQGSIDLEARYSFSQPEPGPNLVVDEFRLQLSDLVVKRKGAVDSLLNLQTVALADGRFELDGNRLTIGQVRVANGTLSVTREKQIIDWQDLVNRTADSPRHSNIEKPKAAAPDWSAELKQLSLESVALVFNDRDLDRPVASLIGSTNLAFSGKAQQAAGQLSAGIEGLELKLNEISMRRIDTPDPLLVVNEAQLHQGRIDLASQSIVVGKIELKGGRTRVVREKDGRLEWESVWDRKRSGQNSAREAQQPGKPWQVVVASVLLEKFDIALSDLSNETAAALHLSPVTLKLTKVSSALDRPIAVDLAISVKEGGDLAMKGELDVAGAAAEMAVDVKALSLLPLRPYLQPVVSINLGSGHLSSNGQLSYGKRQKDSLSYNGAVRIDQLLITEPETGETLLGWEALNAAELDLSLNPDSLLVKEVLLNQPVGKFVVNKDLSTNWQKIAKRQPEAQTPVASERAKRLFPVSVERVQIEAGKLDYSDFSLPLEFSSKVHELSGAIVGISNEPGAKAGSDLKGRVDEFGSAIIKGAIAPFDPLVFTDMSLSFANLDMAHLTPYTAKFAGYLIDSGKLSLDLHYKIDGRKLKGENRIVLNKLKLGKKVESPDAIDAPLELAIALMQDSRGVIDLGLPIQGNLDDPQFSYGHLVGKAFGNLITKIITAPFRVLGAIFGVQGDDLDSVAFEPGSAMLAPPEQEKLNAVVKVLLERPRLALEIKGQYDEKVDGEALREQLIRAEIGKRLGREPAPGKVPDPISLTDARTRAALEELFSKRVSETELVRLKMPPKAQQEADGSERSANSLDTGTEAVSEKAISLAPDFYEKLYLRLIEAQPLAAGALKNLASERGQAIVQGLKKTGKLPGARIKLLDSASVTAPDADKVISKLNLGVGN